MEKNDDFVWAVKSEGHLVTRRAGGSAKQQAKALRDAQPVRTRLARLLKVHTDERAYRIGGKGEETVGARLDKLDPAEWLVLHDIVRNAKGTNIDHLVIGAAGVFVINTKHHPGAKIFVTEKGFRVNSFWTDYLWRSRHEAAKVGEILGNAAGFPVEVRPVIAVMGAELAVNSSPPDVAVIRRRGLPKWFQRLPFALPGGQIREIKQIAGRPGTWKPPELTFKSWSRGGHRRSYVNDILGNSLGYRDEVTGKIHVGDPNDLDRVTTALLRAPRR